MTGKFKCLSLFVMQKILNNSWTHAGQKFGLATIMR